MLRGSPLGAYPMSKSASPRFRYARHPMYSVPSGPAPAKESLHRFLASTARKSSSLKLHVFPPSKVTAMSVLDPSGVDSSLTRSAVASGVPRGTGISPPGSRFRVAMATTMMLFESFGLTKMIGSPAPRFALPRRRYFVGGRNGGGWCLPRERGGSRERHRASEEREAAGQPPQDDRWQQCRTAQVVRVPVVLHVQYLLRDEGESASWPAAAFLAVSRRDGISDRP